MQRDHVYWRLKLKLLKKTNIGHVNVKIGRNCDFA